MYLSWLGYTDFSSKGSKKLERHSEKKRTRKIISNNKNIRLPMLNIQIGNPIGKFYDFLKEKKK